MPLRRPETLTTAVASYIRDAIVRGEFGPGSRLPEVVLAAELDTSRGTVREALRSLAETASSRSSRAAACSFAAVRPRDLGDHQPPGAARAVRGSARARGARRGSGDAARGPGRLRGPARRGRDRRPGDRRRRRRRRSTARCSTLRPRDAARASSSRCSPLPPHRPDQPALVGRRTDAHRAARADRRRPSSCATRSCSRRRSGPTSSRAASC